MKFFFGTEKGSLFKLNNDLTASLVLKTKYSIKFIIFNSENKLFLIVSGAVYDPLSKRYWNKFEHHFGGPLVRNRWGRSIRKYFLNPQYIFLDSSDKLWMIASFGEFGGDLQIFDTKNLTIANNKFDTLRRHEFCPKSVFEGTNGRIFITSGLQHFSNSGAIYSISNDTTSSLLFASSGTRRVERKTGKVLDEGGLFIGAGAYNKIDGKIYFATERGIFSSSLTDDKISGIKLLINPAFTWTAEPLAIGVRMAIKKMAFLEDARAILLTQKDGIGIYDGTTLTMLK